jgi:hypothetical protein
LQLLPDSESQWQRRDNVLAPRFGEPPPLTGSSALGFRDDGRKRGFGRQRDLDAAKLNSRVELLGGDSISPFRRNGWKTEDSLKLPLGGSLYFVGQVGANSDSIEQQQYKFSSTTGIGATLPAGGEIQLRRVRSLTNYDPDDLVLIREQTKSSVEVTLRWKLPGDMKLEYTGEASAAQQLLDHEFLKQDMRLAFPLSNSGQFHIGAKYRAPEPGTATTWMERMKLYLGVEWKR